MKGLRQMEIQIPENKSTADQYGKLLKRYMRSFSSRSTLDLDFYTREFYRNNYHLKHH
jgi:hypothetical protein